MFPFIFCSVNNQPTPKLLPHHGSQRVQISLLLQGPHTSKRQLLSSSNTPFLGVERQGYLQQERWSKKYFIFSQKKDNSKVVKCPIQFKILSEKRSSKRNNLFQVFFPQDRWSTALPDK